MSNFVKYEPIIYEKTVTSALNDIILIKSVSYNVKYTWSEN